MSDGAAGYCNAMSRENVELVRRIYSAWNRGESARAFIDEAVEYVNPPYAVERGIRRGRRSFALMRDSYETWSFRIDELIDAGDEVTVLGRYEARGRGSGLEMEGDQGHVWTVRDGKAVRFRWFHSHEEARAAAGPRE
jgi:ketosteroid isomerase-like protein